MWWPWPISSMSSDLDLENRVRSVASTVLDGFFLYMAQMITIIRGCVVCYFFLILKICFFEFLAIFEKFSTLKKVIWHWPWKSCPLCSIYSSWWILSIFSTNDHWHEKVCRMWWPWTLTYIFKVIRPWLRKSCPLCNVFSSRSIVSIFVTNNHCQ